MNKGDMSGNVKAIKASTWDSACFQIFVGETKHSSHNRYPKYVHYRIWIKITLAKWSRSITESILQIVQA